MMDVGQKNIGQPSPPTVSGCDLQRSRFRRRRLHGRLRENGKSEADLVVQLLHGEADTGKCR
jgi:hypothetical protein